MNYNVTQDAFIERTVEWINRVLLPMGAVDADTPLFASGLINSIRILELIAWTEREIGRTIVDRDVSMANFRTIRRIAEVFVLTTDGAPV